MGAGRLVGSNSRLLRLFSTAIALAAPGAASAAPLLDQQAELIGNPSALGGFSNSLTRAQTFTVGIRGTLTTVELTVSGGATARFEIHPTTNGLPVLGSEALGSAEVTFDTPSLDPPIQVVLDFTSAGIEVEIGDVLAIVQRPGTFSVDPFNTPFWHRTNSAYRYEEGSYYSTVGTSPNDFIDFVPSDAAFRTWVEPGPAVPDTLAFDPDDRTDRPVWLYAEGTACSTTGTNGLADPGCTVYAGGAGPVFADPPLLADLTWSGDVATLALPPAEVDAYLFARFGVVPDASTALVLRFDVVSGAIVGGVLSGAPGDSFFAADLPTPQGPLAFDWLNRTQADRPFEGSVLVGTAFEKQVVASCATEGDAPAPAIANGVCFLQQSVSPGYDPLTSTLTAHAQRDAVFPIEDYSPEFDSLDFAIAERTEAPVVPGFGGVARIVIGLLIAGLGAFQARSATGRRTSSGALSIAVMSIALTAASPDTAGAAERVPVVSPADTLGAQATLVTLLNFTHDTSQPYTTTEVTAMLLDEGSPGSTASYVREASYGRAWLSGGVVGWLPVGYDDTDCRLWTEGGMLDLIYAMDPLIHFGAIDRWVIVIPQNANCGFVGRSTLGKEIRTTADGNVAFSTIILNGLDPSSSPAVAAHELGHSLGALQHSQDYECGVASVGDACTPGATAGDAFNVMGATQSFGHFSAPDKHALHWFDTNLTDVTGPGGTYLIEPYETPSAGTKALRIPVSWSIDELRSSTAYYLSYRTQSGFDAGIPEFATDGVLIQLDADFFQPNDPPATGASLLLDATPGSVAGQVEDSADGMLTIGQTFVDPVHGVTIEVLGRVGADLEVSVVRSAFCGNGVVEPQLGEACDGADLAGETCQALGATSGTLGCTATCTFELAQCGAARCGPGHDYDETSDLCTAVLPLDPATRTLWTNHVTWSGARNQTFARTPLNPWTYLPFYTHQTIDRSWIYRMALPFDTSSIPDDATLVSAGLTLRVLRDGFMFENSHPDSADQLVLVQPTLANPPIADSLDFGSFGSLDAPQEGAGRVDLGDVQAAVDFDIEFDLNATGLGWIDPTGTSLFGLRVGYDVDDVTLPGEEPVILVYLRSEASPTTGPKLTIDYTPVPEPTVRTGLSVGSLALVALRRRRRALHSVERAWKAVG